MGPPPHSTLRAPGSASPARVLTLTQTYGVVTVEGVVRNRFFIPETPYRRVREAIQAATEPGSKTTSSLVGSIASTRQPPAKLVRISSWVIRRGPQSPGWCSLKHRTWPRPPGRTTADRLDT